MNLQIAAFLAVSIAQLTAPTTLGPARIPQQAVISSSRWESEIAAYEKKDAAHPAAKGGIVFVGSSSIRLWSNLETSFPRRNLLNRGFGGSEIRDSTYFANRIVAPYQPRMVVLYAGDNDIAAGRTAEQTAADFKEFAETVRAQLPEAKIAFISIKPSPSRWKFIDTIRSANRKIKEYIRKQKRMVYINVFSAMLDEDGQPRPEFYKADQLHPTEACYALWTKIIGKYLR